MKELDQIQLKKNHRTFEVVQFICINWYKNGF